MQDNDVERETTLNRDHLDYLVEESWRWLLSCKPLHAVCPLHSAVRCFTRRLRVCVGQAIIVAPGAAVLFQAAQNCHDVAPLSLPVAHHTCPPSPLFRSAERNLLRCMQF